MPSVAFVENLRTLLSGMGSEGFLFDPLFSETKSEKKTLKKLENMDKINSKKVVVVALEQKMLLPCLPDERPWQVFSA